MFSPLNIIITKVHNPNMLKLYMYAYIYSGQLACLSHHNNLIPHFSNDCMLHTAMKRTAVYVLWMVKDIMRSKHESSVISAVQVWAKTLNRAGDWVSRAGRSVTTVHWYHTQCSLFAQLITHLLMYLYTQPKTLLFHLG